MIAFQPNYRAATDTGLHRALKTLINTEPKREHDILHCATPETCSSCHEWRKWAREIREVNNEITARQSK